jgi:hypothetical protein
MATVLNVCNRVKGWTQNAALQQAASVWVIGATNHVSAEADQGYGFKRRGPLGPTGSPLYAKIFLDLAHLSDTTNAYEWLN